MLKNKKAIINSLLSHSVIPAYVPACAYSRRCVPACTSTVDDMNVRDSIIYARGCADLNGTRAQDSIVDARGGMPADVRNVRR
jgi:hypothetical protein